MFMYDYSRLERRIIAFKIFHCARPEKLQSAIFIANKNFFISCIRDFVIYYNRVFIKKQEYNKELKTI